MGSYQCPTLSSRQKAVTFKTEETLRVSIIVETLHMQELKLNKLLGDQVDTLQDMIGNVF